MINIFSQIRYLFIALIITCVAMNINLKQDDEKSFKDISYSSIAKNVPIKLERLKNFLSANYLTIQLRFSSDDETFSYGNIFQTGNTNEALRLEFQPLNKSLVLILGDNNQYVIENNLEAYKDYYVKINFIAEDSFNVFLNENNKLSIRDKEIIGKKYDFDNFVVGTGFNQKRNFKGHIDNFELFIKYERNSTFSIIIKYLAILFLSLILSLYSLKLSRQNQNNKLNSCEQYKDLNDQISYFGFIISFIFFGILITKIFSFLNFGFSKWISYILIPFSSLILFYVYNFKEIFWKKIQYLLIALTITYFLVLIYKNLHIGKNAFQYIIIFLLSFLIYILYLYKNKINIKNNLTRYYFPNLILLIIILFSFLIFFDLPNFKYFYENIEYINIFLIFIFFIFVSFFPELISNFKNINLINIDIKFNTVLLFLFYFLSLYLFYILSFRHDSLFIPGSEYHWSYYTGVIEGIKNSGWLLWDTPSQYGFLNIILASMLESKSSWHSFYLFQSILLFITSTFVFFTLIYKFNLSSISKVFVLLVILLSLYFADPSFIGPYPFPSSSVVRFIGVYAFILCSLYLPIFSTLQALSFSLIWLISFFWSAESALYVTSIYFFILAAYLLKMKSLSNFRSIFKYYLISPIILLSLSLLSISVFYKLNIGSYPDFILFFEHAIGYAGGHGYVPFNVLGPGNIMLFLYVCILCNFIKYKQNDARGNNEYYIIITIILASVWTLGSYYIGRPVPQNITAILPILSFITLILIFINKFLFYKNNYIIRIFSISFFLILFLPILNNNFYSTIANIKHEKINIQNNILKSSAKINNLFTNIDITKHKQLVFYGDSATQPIFTGPLGKFNESNWLPVPLQLLENPITESRKETLIKRHLCRNKPNNTLLLADVSQSIKPRLAKFLNNLSKYYNVKLIGNINSFQLYRFSEFSDINCKSKIDQ